MDLHGWLVLNGAANFYAFKSFNLRAGRSVTLHSGQGTDTTTDVYWGSVDYQWNGPIGTALLFDGAQRADICDWSPTAGGDLTC